jgi:hypothetical protein
MSTGTPRFLKAHQTFSVGEMVLGKVPEFPPWPGRVSTFSSPATGNSLRSSIVECQVEADASCLHSSSETFRSISYFIFISSMSLGL